MEQVLRSLQITDLRRIVGDFALPVGILTLMAMLVLPVPTELLDLFFTTNILLALLILLIALNTKRPLDFTAFPTLLLFATVLRLGLNVASTRVVLAEGYQGTDAAGQVIQSFGEFVIGGNYAVGIFVFIILVIINLVVITRGAGRISEVSARFTLDALPGKQMAIDADLNAGLLAPDEAKKRREEIAQEADFYGSMDGASKFVKGDAIAGILILLINIIGGLAVGVLQYEMPLAEAAANFLVLSVGDGLVAQIPSLLLALGTAVIVTRISTEHDLSEQVQKQLGVSKAWLPAGALLALIGAIPGMPNVVFLSASAFAFVTYYLLRKSEEKEPEKAEIETDSETDSEEIDLDEVAEYAPITLQVGYGLIPLVDPDGNGPLVGRVTSIRKRISQELGFIIPQIRIRDDLTLESNQYRLKIGQTIVGEDICFPDKKLAIAGETPKIKLRGENVTDPSFGLEAVWISSQDVSEAESNGFMIVDPDAVIGTHLNKLIRKHAEQLLGQDDVQSLLDALSERSPQLVETVVPKVVSLQALTQILQTLLNEQVPITDMPRILRSVSIASSKTKDPYEIAEQARSSLAPIVLQNIFGIKDKISVITLDTDLEQMLINTKRQAGQEEFQMEPNLAETLLSALKDSESKLSMEGKTAVFVTSPFLRRDLSKLLRQQSEDLVVMGFSELPDNRQVEIVSVIGKSNQSKTSSEEK